MKWVMSENKDKTLSLQSSWLLVPNYVMLMFWQQQSAAIFFWGALTCLGVAVAPQGRGQWGPPWYIPATETGKSNWTEATVAWWQHGYEKVFIKKVLFKFNAAIGHERLFLHP